MKTSDIQILTKSELQEDWYTSSTVEASSTGGLAINLDRNGRLAIAFINGGSIMAANRNLDADGTSIRTWSVEDTRFPSSTSPIYLDSMRAPSNDTFLSAIGDDNNVYFLDCSSRFPSWECCANNVNVTPVRLSIFTSRPNDLLISVLTSDGEVYIVDPVGKTWSKDLAVAHYPVFDYKIGSAIFTQMFDQDKSIWGYLVSGDKWGDHHLEAGVSLVSGAPDLSLLSTECMEDGEKYSSLACAIIGGNMPRTKPLIFGINESKKATYLQGQTFSSPQPVYPFGTDLDFTHLDAIFRTGFDAVGNTIEWIDLFALDTSGKLWHTRNMPNDTGRFSAIERLYNSHIVVSDWETPSIITSKAIKSFDLTAESNGSGHAYVVTELDSSTTSTSLEVYVQDMSSTGWTKTPITTINHAAPEVLKRNVYYVELTVSIGGAVSPGLTVKITAPEYCQIDANGVSTSVSSGQSYTTKTNARGLICLTIPSSESLACPALSVWVQGMDADQRIDVQPAGSILHRFSKITVDRLKKAKDKKDQSLVFGKLSDSQLDDLKTSLNEVASAFLNYSPISVPSKSIGDSTTQTSSDLYLHPNASREVSATRHVSNRHMGMISGTPQGKSFRIRLRPTLSFEYVTNSSGKLGGPVGLFAEMTSSWGDFWTQVTNKATSVSEMAFTSVKDGVQVAVTCVVHGVSKLWNGVATFVRQVFDVIKEIFKSVRVATAKIFNWLAYFFAWDDIKTTAVNFRSIFDDQLSYAQGYIGNSASTQLDKFFKKAKGWLQDNTDTALSGSKNLSVGANDKPQSDPSNLLPSSASWLSNKVDNSVKSEVLDQVFTTTDTFATTVQRFMNKVTATGVSDDLSKALQDASKFFLAFKSRDDMNKLTFDVFIQVFKDIAVVLLDFGQAVIYTLLDVLVEVLKILKDAIDTPIDIPVISKIFKELVGLDLTFFNLIIVPLAIPATILYKSIMGEAPFSDSTEAMALSDVSRESQHETKEKDPSMFWSTFLMMVYGSTDSIMDFYGPVSQLVDPYREFDPVMKFITYTNMVSSMLMLGLSTQSAPTNTRTTFILEATTIGTVCGVLSVVWDSLNRTKFGTPLANSKLMDIIGTAIPTFYGFASITSGVWHIVNIANGSETGSIKDWFIVTAELSGAIPGCAKVVKITMNPEVWVPPLAVINIVGYVVAVVSYGAAT